MPEDATAGDVSFIATLANKIRRRQSELLSDWANGLAKERSDTLHRISSTDEGKALLAEKIELDAEYVRDIERIEARWTMLAGVVLKDATLVLRDFEARRNAWQERCNALHHADERARVRKNAAIPSAGQSVSPDPAAVKPDAVAVVPDGFYSPTDLAKAVGNPGKAEAIRKLLGRMMKENQLPDTAWLENNNPASGQAKILYKLSAVRPHLSKYAV